MEDSNLEISQTGSLINSSGNDTITQAVNIIAAEEVDQNFSEDEDHADQSKAEITRFLEADGGSITIGPSYQTHSSKGELININTAYRMVMIQEVPNCKILFTATDQHGSLLGHRITGLEEREDFFLGLGDIHTVKRNAGVAIPIELAHADFLTRYAQEHGKEVEYFVVNGNENYRLQKVKELEALNKQLEHDENWHRRKNYLEKEISRTEEEQLRWVKIWGPNGILGYDAQGIKVFDPVFSQADEPLPMNTIDTIKFERIDTAGKAIAQIQAIEAISSDTEERRLKELQKLRDIVSTK